jgi:hypothetical protein
MIFNLAKVPNLCKVTLPAIFSCSQTKIGNKFTPLCGSALWVSERGRGCVLFRQDIAFAEQNIFLYVESRDFYRKKIHSFAVTIHSHRNIK